MATPEVPIYIYDRQSLPAYALSQILKAEGLAVEFFSDALRSPRKTGMAGLLIIPDCDAVIDYVSSVINELDELRIPFPAFAYSLEAPHPERIVSAIKAGAVDYIVGKVSSNALCERIAMSRNEIDDYFTLRSICFEAQGLLADLTRRELEVLELVSEGRTSREIAEQLGISHRTVEVHRAAFMRKLGACHVIEAVRLYANANLVQIASRSETNDGLEKIKIEPQAIWPILDVL